MAVFVRDKEHWLFKWSPEEWIQTAMAEIQRAEDLYRAHDAKGGLAGARRAAGMALNGALIVAPNDGYGRTYVEHLRALAKDDSAPQAVRDGAQLLMATQPPGPVLISLRSTKSDDRVLEAARDVMAHAYAIVKRNEPYHAGQA